MMRRLAAGAVLAAVWLVSCAGQAKGPVDSLTDLQDPKLPVERRVEALDRAWSGSEGERHQEAMAAVREIAWSVDEPPALRMEAIKRLVSDPVGLVEVRKSALQMIPDDPSLEVVGLLGDEAGRRGWSELVPALVRSYARPGKGPDAERPERRALLALVPGHSVEEIAFGVFTEAGPRPGIGPDSARRARSAAWDLLARLDADGSARAALIEGQAPPASDADRTLGDLRACLAELRTVPLTGEELVWLESLRDPGRPENAAWWGEAASAVSRLTAEQAGGLRLRHAEPVRWAGANRSQWLAADRAGLLAELAIRLEGRTVHPRTVRVDLSKRPSTERLAGCEAELSWGDVLTILVVDEAVHDPAVVIGLFKQALEDRNDDTTEYGGLLFLRPQGPATMLYPPRPTERFSDTQFVASSDMIDQGDLAAAHYHFHVNRVGNSPFSGPSEGDVAYAARYGRACVVFTSIMSGVMSADYYQGGGAVLDLGELREAP